MPWHTSDEVLARQTRKEEEIEWQTNIQKTSRIASKCTCYYSSKKRAINARSMVQKKMTLSRKTFATSDFLAELAEETENFVVFGGPYGRKIAASLVCHHLLSSRRLESVFFPHRKKIFSH